MILELEERPMKVLIVEDDDKISQFIQKGLKESGFAVDSASKGLDGLHLAQENEYDAIVMDIMLPEVSGFDIIERLRQVGVQTPVIILSAKKSLDDRVLGLKKGGDDYITKPFHFTELLARIEALVRRSQSTQNNDPTVLKFADLEVNLETHDVKRGSESIHLNQKEFRLLCFLIKNAKKVVTKTRILEHVYEYDFDPQTNVVDVLVFRLRTKIDKNFEKKLLHTVRGIGYQLNEE